MAGFPHSLCKFPPPVAVDMSEEAPPASSQASAAPAPPDLVNNSRVGSLGALQVPTGQDFMLTQLLLHLDYGYKCISYFLVGGCHGYHMYIGPVTFPVL